MKNKKEVYILYSYNQFENDFENIMEYETLKELEEKNKDILKTLKNKKSIYSYVKTSLEDNLKLINDRYLIIKEKV